MKFKSFIVLSLLILTQMLSLTMCEKAEYTVTFDTMGGSEIKEQIVIQGGYVLLPHQPNKIGHKFMGWYCDKEYSERFLSSKPISKDTTVFAKWELVEMPPLSTLILNQNYKYDLEYTVDNQKYIEHYEYSPNVLKQTFQDSSEYIIKDEYNYYLTKNNNQYFAYDEFSNKFNQNKNLFFGFLINKIDPNNWYLDEYFYRPLSDKFEEEVEKLLGYVSNIQDVYLYINNNALNASVTFNDNVEYHIIINYIEDFIVEVPHFEYAIDENYITIDEALEKNNNQIVIINGAIYSDLGEYYYALDNSGGIFIKKNDLNLTTPYYYKIKGVINKSSSFSYLDNIISYEKTNTYITSTPSDILGPRNITEQNLDIMVYFNNFIVSEIVEDGDYLVITVKYEDETGKIVSHKSFSWNEEIKVNDIISIEQGVIQLYDDTPVIYLTKQANLTFGEIKVEDLTIPTTLSVEQNTDYDAFVSSILVKARYNNGVETILDSSKYEITGTLDLNTVGEYTITISSGEISNDIIVFVTTYSEYGTYDEDAVDLDTLISEENLKMSMPRSGNANILVIPILFPDYDTCNNMKANLEKAFFGTKEVNGYYSLTEYYYLSSFGKLNITGDVVEPFKVSRNSSYYKNHENGDGLIMEEALAYYEEQLDLTDYDGNNDGVIDGIYIIYNHPTDSTGDSFWWAYVTNNQNYHDTYDNMYINYYCFAGYEFILEDMSDGTSVAINSTTYIHETGHMLGLTDYYDYDESEGISGGLGGGDMMDYNVGDHNPFSKALLGWVTPLVLEKENMTFELESYSKTGECVIIPYNWNGTYFDEYLIIDYYTPTDLYFDMAGVNGLFSERGLRIYHIKANTKDSLNSMLSIFENDNSYTTEKLITLIENDMSNFIGDDNFSTDEDLFKELDSLNNFKWSDGTDLGLSITVNSITTDAITITINVK